MIDHIEPHQGGFRARRAIPSQLRIYFGGKAMLRTTLKHADGRLIRTRREAQIAARPILTEMDRQLDAASRQTDPLESQLDKVRQEAAAKGLVADDALLAGARMMAQLLGISHAAERAHVTADRSYDANSTGKLRHGTDHLMGVSKSKTDILAHLNEWPGLAQYAPHSRAQAISNIKAFAAGVAVPLEQLTSAIVQAYADRLKAEGMKTGTIKQKVKGAVAEYHAWLRSRGYAPNIDPLLGINTKGAPSMEKIRFEPEEVVTLMKAADPQLRDFIDVARYTGMRIETVACLNRDNTDDDVKMHLDAALPYLDIKSDKTLSGRRKVVIASVLMPTLRRLCATPYGKDGYVFAGPPSMRSGTLGGKFTTLKQRLGFGNEKTFHCIRHTVIHLFESMECPETTCQAIVGHKRKSLTYGTYAGLVPLADQVQWVERLRYPD